MTTTDNTTLAPVFDITTARRRRTVSRPQCADGLAPVVALRPEALRPLTDAFIAGAAGAIAAAPREGIESAHMEAVLTCARLTVDDARRAGALAALPAQWSTVEAIATLERAPTLGELLDCGAEALCQCIAAMRSAERRSA